MLPQLDRGQLYIYILSACYVLISVLWVNMRRILSCFPVHPCYVPQFQKMSFHGIFQFVCTCGSAGKESACNAGNLGWSLGWEDLLEKGKATHSSIPAWRIPWTVHGVAKSWTDWATFTFTYIPFVVTLAFEYFFLFILTICEQFEV